MHLVDHARAYIEETYRRPPFDRALRWTLARVLPYPRRFRAALIAARVGRPFAPLMPRQIAAMLRLAPRKLPPPSPVDAPQVFPAEGERRKRVALLTGCAQQVLDTGINAATVRLLTRHGCEVVIARGMGCCGALPHHMGRTRESHAFAADNIRAWMREVRGAGLDAIVINTSGCGTTVKDYGHIFRTDQALAEDAATVSGLTRDVTELMAELGLKEPKAPGLRVAYHAACSLQHGQQVRTQPKALLRQAGFEVVEPRDAHLCCGSAGTYNLMQPEISAELQRRKVGTLEALEPQIIAAGNIGCMIQIGAASGVPVVHTAELLDWATGGERPAALPAQALPASGASGASPRHPGESGRDAMRPDVP
jgi:glycolate oxidase iron-sulfur subunit